MVTQVTPILLPNLLHVQVCGSSYGDRYIHSLVVDHRRFTAFTRGYASVLSYGGNAHITHKCYIDAIFLNILLLHTNEGSHRIDIFAFLLKCCVAVFKKTKLPYPKGGYGSFVYSKLVYYFLFK